MIYDNILETIGNTPVVRINHMAPQGVTMYAKLESFNPMGSVKDRPSSISILGAAYPGPACRRRHRLSHWMN